jgi:hypothetical protein
MKMFSKAAKRNSLLLTALACAILAGSICALAINNAQIFRYTGSPLTLTGACCFAWGETVSLTEPATVVPVIVTFSSDYQATLEGQVGLSLNGGSCNLFYGPNRLPEFTGGSGGAGPYAHIDYQWVIRPTDGLKVGKNTFQLCGGGSFGGDATIVLGFNTLAVHGSN